MNDSTRPLVLGLGELLWDVFENSRRPGGAPANVAFHAGQMGAESAVLTRIGEDDLGRELLEFLKKQGMHTDTVQKDSDHPTGRVTVDTTRPDHPTYIIHEDVAWDFMELDNAWRIYLSRASAVCFGSLAQRSIVSRETIMTSLEVAGGALKIFDINLRPPYIDGNVLHNSMELSEVAKFNIDELEPLAKAILVPGNASQPEEFCEKLLDRYQRLETICITRGDEGCLIVDRNQGRAERPGLAIQVADTVGAGDTFTAGLAIGLVNQWSIDQVAAFANRAAAETASNQGAMPPLREKFGRIKEEVVGG
jgi:fructokinase